MSNPVFHYLLDQYQQLVDQGLDRTDEANNLFGEMMRYAPPEYQKVAHDMAVQMGLMPEKPDGYSDDGEPLYNLDAMRERLGVNPDDVPDHILAEAYTGNVHRVN